MLSRVPAIVLVTAALVTACGSGGSTGAVSIGAGLRGPSDLSATIYTRGLTHVSALTFDAKGRLWATTSGSATHATDGVYLVAHAGARPVKVVSGLVAPLGIIWVGEKLFVSSLGRVTAYSDFNGSQFGHQTVILRGPVAGGENNNLVLAPNGRLVMGVSAVVRSLRSGIEVVGLDRVVPARRKRAQGRRPQRARCLRARVSAGYEHAVRDDEPARRPGGAHAGATGWPSSAQARTGASHRATARRRRPVPTSPSRLPSSTRTQPPAASRSSQGNSATATSRRLSSLSGSWVSSNASRCAWRPARTPAPRARS